MNLHKNVKTIRLFLAKLFIAFKIVYSCCFSLGGNLDFPEFLQKSFYINYRAKNSKKRRIDDNNFTLRKKASSTLLKVEIFSLGQMWQLHKNCFLNVADF